MPPMEGAERVRFREQAQRDFSDFAMIGDAEADLVDGILTLPIEPRDVPHRARGRLRRGAEPRPGKLRRAVRPLDQPP